MKNKYKLLIFLVLLAAFAGVAIFDVKKTLDAHETVEKLRQEEHLDASSKEVLQSWKEFNRDRLVTAGIVCGYFVIITIYVVSIGGAAPGIKHISKDEADSYIDEINAEYIRKNQLVEASEDADDGIDIELVDKLGRPELKSLVYEEDHIILEWNPVENAEGYIVYRKTPNTDWEKRGKNIVGQTFYEDYMLEGDTTYIYTVRAFIKEDGKRLTSTTDPLGLEVYVKDSNYPDVPEIFETTDPEGRRCIGWKPMEGMRSYRIYKKNSDGSWTKIAKVLSEEPPYYYDEAMGDDTKECYSVCAARFFKTYSVEGKFNEQGLYI